VFLAKFWLWFCNADIAEGKLCHDSQAGMWVLLSPVNILSQPNSHEGVVIQSRSSGDAVHAERGLGSGWLVLMSYHRGYVKISETKMMKVNEDLAWRWLLLENIPLCCELKSTATNENQDLKKAGALVTAAGGLQLDKNSTWLMLKSQGRQFINNSSDTALFLDSKALSHTDVCRLQNFCRCKHPERAGRHLQYVKMCELEACVSTLMRE
jgi:hypothetical protein